MVSSPSQVWPKTARDLGLAALERLEVVLAVVEDDARKGVVDAVVDVVAGPAVAHRLADHACDRGRGRRHQEAAGLGQDLHVLREQPADLGVDRAREQAERLHVAVVGHREAAADVEDLDRAAAALGLVAHRRRHGRRPGRSSRSSCTGCRRGSSAPRRPARGRTPPRSAPRASPGSQPNFEDSSTIEPVFGTRSRSARPACGAYLRSLRSSSRLSKVTSGLVAVEGLERLLRLDRVRVDDLVPDEVLPRLRRADPRCSRGPA